MSYEPILSIIALLALVGGTVLVLRLDSRRLAEAATERSHIQSPRLRLIAFGSAGLVSVVVVSVCAIASIKIYATRGGLEREARATRVILATAARDPEISAFSRLPSALSQYDAGVALAANAGSFSDASALAQTLANISSSLAVRTLTDQAEASAKPVTRPELEKGPIGISPASLEPSSVVPPSTEAEIRQACVTFVSGAANRLAILPDSHLTQNDARLFEYCLPKLRAPPQMAPSRKVVTEPIPATPPATQQTPMPAAPKF